MRWSAQQGAGPGDQPGELGAAGEDQDGRRRADEKAAIPTYQKRTHHIRNFTRSKKAPLSAGIIL